MSLIRIDHLSFAYDGAAEPVFDDASFQIDTAWRLGLIGRNGRGKTTLLKLLTGEEDAGGAIQTSTQFQYFPYEVPRVERTAREVFRDLCQDAQDWQLDVELSRLGVGQDVPDRAFSTLSHGERTKVLLACLFLREGRFALIDEPTNHLDEEARRAVSSYLAQQSGFIVVSHDRELLDSVCDHILSIEKKRILVRSGNFSTWQEEAIAEENAQRARNKKLKKEISRLDEAAKRVGCWAGRAEKAKHKTSGTEGFLDRGYMGHRAAKMMSRANAIQKRKDEAADEKRGLLLNVDSAADIAIRCLPCRSGSVVCLRDVRMFHGGVAVNDSPVRLDLQAGGRLAVTGTNGAGKSTLLQVVLGADIEFEGERSLQSQLRISYLPQDTSALSGSLRGFIEDEDIPLDLYFTLLIKLGFRREELDKDLADLSMGQQRKAALAKSLATPAHLYVWDEPLNYVDVLTRVQIEEMILRCQPTMLFVDHDGVFRRKVATSTLRL